MSCLQFTHHTHGDAEARVMVALEAGAGGEGLLTTTPQQSFPSMLLLLLPSRSCARRDDTDSALHLARGARVRFGPVAC